MSKMVSQYANIAGLNRALRELPKEAHITLREESNEIATKVAADARGLATRVGGIAQYVVPTIKASRGDKPAVRMGGSGRLRTGSRPSRQPNQVIGGVIWGAEYGGQRFRTTQRGGSTMQFKPWRGSSTGAGYFLWPTIRRDNTQEKYSAALLRAMQRL